MSSAEHEKIFFLVVQNFLKRLLESRPLIRKVLRIKQQLPDSTIDSAHISSLDNKLTEVKVTEATERKYLCQ